MMEPIVPATVVGDGRIVLVGDVVIVDDKRVKLSKRDIMLMLVYYAGILRYDVSRRIRDLLEKSYPEVYRRLNKVMEEAECSKVYPDVGEALADCSMLVTRVNRLSKELEALDSEYEELNRTVKVLDKLIATLQRHDPSLRAVDTHVIWG